MMMLVAAMVLPWATRAQDCTQAIPFFEGFETTTAVTSYSTAGSVPNCWYAFGNGTSAGYVPHVVSGNTSYIYRKTGEKSLVFSANTSAATGSRKYLVLPPMAVPLNQLQLSFWMCPESVNYGSITVGYLTSGNDTSTFTPIAVYPCSMAIAHSGNGLQVNTGLDVELVLSNVPETATRLAIRYDQTGSSLVYSCCIDDVGLDYIPTCPKVDSVEVAAETNSAVVSWVERGTATEWEVVVRRATGAVVDSSRVTVDSIEVTGLDPNTPYMVTVRAVCSDSDISGDKTASFRTDCMALTTDDMPYFYDFDDATGSGAAYAMDQCWGRYHSSGTTNYPNPSSTQKHSGTYGLYMYNTSTIKRWATLPELDASVDVSTLTISFWAYKTAAAQGRLKVGVMTDPDNIATFTQMASLQVSATSTWEYYEIPLTGYTGGGRYVTIMADSTGLNHSYVDDVTLLVTPSCLRPEAIVMSGITSTGATLTITDPTNVGQYIVEVTGDTTFSETIYSLSYEMDDLMPNSEYTVSVSAVCPDGNATAPLLTAFQTPCLPYPTDSLPLVEDFDSYTGSTTASATNRMDIDCWRVVDRYLTNYPYYSTSQHHSGANSLYFYTSTAHPTVITLPLFEAPVSDLELIFWARVATAGNSVEVGYMSNPDDTSTFVLVGTAAPSAVNTWEEFVINFPSNAAGFIAIRKGNGITVYLDDITVHLAPACARMQGFTVDNITSVGADVTIADAALVGNYVINAISAADTVHFETNVSPFTLTGLQSSTPYILEVYSVCDDGSTTHPYYDEFRTACAPISQLPWTEDFESHDASAAPYCWTNVAGTTNVIISESLAHSGEKRLDFRGTTTGNIILLPPLASDLNWSDLSIHFWTRPESTAANCGYFMVGYYTVDENEDTVFVVLDSLNVADFGTASYQEVDVSLAGAPDEIRPAFVHMANSTAYYWYVDDVTIYATPSCARAQRVSIASLSDSTVDVIIVDSNHVGSYVVELIHGQDTVTVSTNDTLVHFGNLTADTNYTIRMASDCGDGYTLPITYEFRTPCEGIDSLPWTETFDSYTGATSSSAASRMDLPCWTVPYRSSANYPYFNNSSTYNTSGNCLYTNTNTVVVLPSFELPPSQLMFSFKVRVATANYGMAVGVITNPSDVSTFTPVMECVPTATGEWQEFSVTFAGWEEGFIAVRQIGTTTYSDDYHVEALPECTAPSQIVVSEIDSVSATVTILDANATNHYHLYLSEEDSVGVVLTSDTYQMTGLTPNTGYKLRAYTICANGTTTENYASVDFHTACIAQQPLPYYENFDGMGALSKGDGTDMEGSAPPCWDVLGHSGSLIALYSATAYRYGESGYSLKFKSGIANTPNYLILPAFEQPISALEITFQTRPEGTNANSGTFDIGYMTDPANDSTFVVVDHYVYSDFNGAYQLKDALFTGAPDSARIAMRHTPTTTGWFWFVDEIDVHMAPTCRRPASVTVDNVTGNSATVHITDANAAMHYYCCFDNGATIDTVEVYDTVATVSTLNPATNYTLRVYTACGTETSTTAAQTTFITGCGAIGLPVFYDMESYATGSTAALPPCWTRLNNATNSYNYYPYIYSSSTYAHSGSKTLYYSFSTTSGYATDEIMVFPEIDTVNFPINQVEVSFWARSGSKNRKLIVGVLTNPDSMSTFQPVDTVRLTTTVSPYFVELGAFQGYGAYIGLKSYKDTNASISIYVDDIKIEVGSPCMRSRNVTASNASATTVDLGWTDLVDYTQWRIRYTQDTLDTWTEVTANSNPFTLTGLSANTIYRAVVAPVCASGETGFFSRDTVRFNTSSVPAMAPYHFDFDSVDEWQNWYTGSNNGTNWYRGNIALGDSSNAMYMSADSGATHSWSRRVVTNVAAYRDIDFGPVPHNYVLTFSYIGGGHTGGNYDGVSVLLVDPATVVGEIPGTNLDSPWGRITTVHARRDSNWATHTVTFDGVSGVRRLVFYHFNDALTDSTLFVNIPPAIDDIDLAIPECERPYGLTVDAVTDNSATIHWQGDDSATYRIDYRPAGTTNTDLFDTVVGLSHTITGLDPHTTYNVWVKTLCTDSVQSIWSSYETFTTLCGYEPLPYSEDFESIEGTTYNTAGVLPTCWEAYTNGSATYLPHVTGSGSYWYPHSGTKVLTMTSSSNASSYGTTKVAALPPFNAPMSSLKMSFWYRMESATSGTLTVGYVTDIAQMESSFVQVAAIPNTTTLTCDTISFANVPDNALQIAFRWYQNGTYYSVGIDDIAVWMDEAPTCAAPVIVDTAVEETAVTVTWLNSAATYEVAIMEGSWDDSLATSITTTDTVKTFSGLTAATQYVVGVRAVCAAGVVSEWTLQSLVTAEHPCYMPTGVTITGLALDGGTVSWTAGEEGQSEFEVRVYNNIYDSTFAVSEATSIVLTGLYSNTDYNVAVRAVCGEDYYSGWTEPIVLTPSTCAAPTGVTATAEGREVTVSWQGTGAERYRVTYYDEFSTIANATTVDVEGATSTTVTVPEGGMDYSFYVQAYCGDALSTYSDPATVSIVGIEAVEGMNVSLYPNPASSSVTLSGIEGPATVTVVDLNGRESGRWQVNEGSLTIDLGGYAKGAYFVRIAGERAVTVRKLVVR